MCRRTKLGLTRRRSGWRHALLWRCDGRDCARLSARRAPTRPGFDVLWVQWGGERSRRDEPRYKWGANGGSGLDRTPLMISRAVVCGTYVGNFVTTMLSLPVDCDGVARHQCDESDFVSRAGWRRARRCTGLRVGVRAVVTTSTLGGNRQGDLVRPTEPDISRQRGASRSAGWGTCGSKCLDDQGVASDAYPRDFGYRCASWQTAVEDGVELQRRVERRAADAADDLSPRVAAGISSGCKALTGLTL